MEDENDSSYVIQWGVYFMTMQNSTFEGSGIGPLRRWLEEEKYFPVKTQSVHKQRNDKIRIFYAFLRVDRRKIWHTNIS